MTRLVRFSNNAVSNLAANLTLSGTSLSVTSGDGAKFPAISAGQYFMATIVKADGSTEVVKVTARSTDTLTIVRAAEPVAGASTSYAFSAGDRIEARLTAGVLSEEIDRLDNGAVVEAVNKSANYTLTADDVTKLVRVTTTSGTTTITLPDTSALPDDYDVIVAKVTSDANTVVIARTGTTDLINGATSYTIYNQWQSAWLIADRSTNTWTVISSGISAVNTVVDNGTGDGSTATVTLSGDPGSKNNVAFFVGGVYQQKATFSLSGTTLTPGATIANGVTWEAVWSAPLTVGTPSDGTVTTAKLADNAVTTAKIANANVTPAKLAGSVDFSFYGVTVGRGAGSVATNTAVGASALAANTSGFFNAAFGDSALSTNQTGAGNAAFGHDALKVMLNVNNNSAFGSQALTANTTGTGNTGLGSNALVGNTTGSNNVAVGLQALNANTTASNNTAVGYQAGYANTTGTDLVAVGYLAAANNTTGNQVVAIGRGALYYNTTGSSNVAVGMQALVSNTTANNNTAVGYQAGYSNTTGSGNVNIGKAAGYSNSTSSNNVYIGGSAGYNATGQNNVMIGDGAGYDVTTGSQNTFIGGGLTNTRSGAGSAVTTGSKNTILGGYTGNQGGLDIRTANNYIVLSDGDGNPRLFFNSSGLMIATNVYGSTTASAANVVVAGDGLFQRSTSALKYKQDIRDVEDFDISLLRPVRYKSKCEGDDQAKDHLGLIADEAAEAGFEELVNRGIEGDVEGFQYERLTVVLLKKLQTLDAKFNAYVATHP